ncbi:MAG: histidine kinase dimerization/phosphoacceptor domain -containing protein [Tistlia sp.]|uniref:sensor histidine kinase n=1 Tax=Tistlia sp. TaxID=3057121 RepID=UPI0034A413FD
MSVALGLMRAFERSRKLRALGWFGYAFGLAGCGLALGLPLWLGDAMASFPYLTFYPVVVLTTFFGGVRPGIFSAALGGLAAWYFLMPPGPGFGLLWPSTYLALALYLLTVALNIAVIDALSRALAGLAAQQRRTARLLARQATLFRELQHRVANNMAFVASLLTLQKRKLDPNSAAADALEDARGRIFTMERIHRRLHDPAQVDLPVGAFLEELCRDILEANGNRTVACRVEAPPLVLDFDRLVTLSMLVAEIVLNALKHAYGPDQAGSILVSLEGEAASGLELRVRDDGRGLPPGFDPDRSSGLGMRIVQGLVTQLGGTIEWRAAEPDGSGTLAVVRFAVQG